MDRLPYQPYGPSDISIHIFHCFAQLIFMTSYFVLFTTSLSMFFSFNFYICAFCEDFCDIFNRMDDEWKCPIFKPMKIEMMLLDALKFEKILTKYKFSFSGLSITFKFYYLF